MSEQMAKHPDAASQATHKRHLRISRRIMASNAYTEISVDPEFRSMIPPLGDDERNELEKSILADGCRDALVLWGNTIIDGYNRFEICRRNQKSFKTVRMEFPNRDAAKVWIIRNQLARRNLTDVQRGRMALAWKEIIAAQGKERQKEHGGTAPGRVKQETLDPILDQVNHRTLDSVAEMAGLSHGTIHKIETVDNKAPEPVKQAMEAEVISINKAYEATKAAERQPEIKNQLERTMPQNVPEVLAEAFKQARDEAKRQSKIMDYWCIMSTLNYNVTDYELWLSDLSEDAIDTQLEIVDSGIKKALAIQKRLHEICAERRRLRLVK